MSQFNLFGALAAKEEGLEATSGAHEDFLETMRFVAGKYADRKGWTSSDDIRRYAQKHGIEPQHPNAWGAVFSGDEWEAVGWTRSMKISNHGRMIRKWRKR